MTRFCPLLARLDRLVHHGGDGVGGFRRGHDAFGAGEQRRGLEDLGLVVRLGLNQAQLERVADHRGHAVVAQAAGMNGRRHELVAQGVHHHQRRRFRGVAEIVAQFALGQRRAGGGFHAPRCGISCLP